MSFLCFALMWFLQSPSLLKLLVQCKYGHFQGCSSCTVFTISAPSFGRVTVTPKASSCADLLEDGDGGTTGHGRGLLVDGDGVLTEV